MCGSSGCVRASLANCQMRPACHGHMAQTALIRKQVAEGKTHDAIIATFVAQYGQHVLDSPVDRGFNRLAWLLPYLLAAAGLVMIVMNARRWSHRPAVATSGPSPGADPALDARLDDELRDLD
jgi:cytochrome c-type biogenesis protein CcmH/NrfF